MKLVNLGFVVLTIAMGPRMIGQEQYDPLHLMGPQDRVNIGFTADNIERQDPPGASADGYASDLHLKGHVVIRACCLQRGLDGGAEKKAMFIRADDVMYHSRADELELVGPARISFQNYPK